MYVVSRISHAKVEPHDSRESDEPMRVKTRRSNGIVAASAGTWQPMWARSVTRATCEIWMCEHKEHPLEGWEVRLLYLP